MTNTNLHYSFGNIQKLHVNEVEVVKFEEVNTKVLLAGLIVAIGIAFLLTANPFPIAYVAYLGL